MRSDLILKGEDLYSNSFNYLTKWVPVQGGVRLRSSLSPGGGQNQKGHFKAITGTFFIDSYKLGAYYIKSYKKMDQKTQKLEIT